MPLWKVSIRPIGKGESYVFQEVVAPTEEDARDWGEGYISRSGMKKIDFMVDVIPTKSKRFESTSAD